MENGMAFFFRIANQPVVKFICPDTGEMLVHQMLADADIQGAHQHIPVSYTHLDVYKRQAVAS